jgi:hypothetical protein
MSNFSHGQKMKDEINFLLLLFMFKKKLKSKELFRGNKDRMYTKIGCGNCHRSLESDWK